jgi:hypothetical protein
MNSNHVYSPRKALGSRFRRAFPVRRALLVILVTLACHAFGQTLTTLYSFGSAPHDGVFPGFRRDYRCQRQSVWNDWRWRPARRLRHRFRTLAPAGAGRSMG